MSELVQGVSLGRLALMRERIEGVVKFADIPELHSVADTGLGGLFGGDELVPFRRGNAPIGGGLLAAGPRRGEDHVGIRYGDRAPVAPRQWSRHRARDDRRADGRSVPCSGGAVKFCAETPQVTASSYLPTVLPLSDVERILRSKPHLGKLALTREVMNSVGGTERAVRRVLSEMKRKNTAPT